jgi:hypothetical protein
MDCILHGLYIKTDLFAHLLKVYDFYLYLARLSFRILESKPLGLQTFQFGFQIILTNPKTCPRGV